MNPNGRSAPNSIRPSANQTTVTLTRIYHFSASHRLPSPHLTPEENVRLYGRCHRLHGHNYYVEVSVLGTPHPRTGMAANLTAVDDAVERELPDHVDHRHLDEPVPEVDGEITTGETLARVFWRLLAPVVPALSRVAVMETANNRFEYSGHGEGPA
jgi:6-pyruvoyltetrahydropterin/6-carboxytetrahydropterin synthase